MREIPTSAPVYEAPVAEGYRGVWYSVRGGAGRGPEPWNVNKYGGAMATYPQQHAPIAIHVTDEAADNNTGIDRTYFVFGGFNGDPARTPNMIGYFDHTTGLLARPRTLLTRGTLDAHENPTLAIDTAGHLLVFSPSHGAERRSFITRSAEPWAIDRWQRVAELPGGDAGETFSYPQPHHVPGQGFLLLNTHYRPGGNRTLYLNRSVDGVDWEYDWAVGGANPRPKLAAMEHGQYQISWRFGNTIATAFNMHPKGSRGTPLDHRTNLYFAQTSDLGRTWTTAAGEVLGDLPLLEKHNSALVADYQRQGLNVYLKDVQQDAAGRPVILFLTSGGSEAGPANGPRTLRTARFDGTAWIIRDVLQTDHNYDHGSLFIHPDGTWQLIGPFLPGAQPFGTGGNIGVWLSHDQGSTWTFTKRFTDDAERNHSYVRRVFDPHDDFVAMWSAANAFEPSPVEMFFTNAAGEVFAFPTTFEDGEEFAEPTRVG